MIHARKDVVLQGEEEILLVIEEEGTLLDAAEETVAIPTQIEMTAKARGVMVVGEAAEKTMT